MSKQGTPQKLGAQRFYNAVKEGNVGFAAMYVNSVNSETVQPFNYSKTFQAWKANRNIEMLGVLMQHQPLCRYITYGYRRRRDAVNEPSNDVYYFAFDVMQLIRPVLQNPLPDEKNLLFATDVLSVMDKAAFEGFNLNFFSDTAQYIGKAHIEDKNWPLQIAAASHRVARHLFRYPRNNYTQWYLDTYGYPNEETTSVLRHVLWDRFNRGDYEPIMLLYPDPVKRKDFFKEGYYANHINNANEGHKTLLHLKATVAPWLSL